MKAAGAYETPGGKVDPTTHARAARRAVKRLLAAKRQGDHQSADLYAEVLRAALDRHLETIRGRPS